MKKVGPWILKPRPIFWEWLFLAGESPLRQYCSNLSDDPFTYFPILKFPEPHSIREFSENKQEYFEDGNLETVSGVISEALGRLLGIIHFFGLSDLHFENLKIGVKDEDCYFFPVDIETAFDPLNLISQSYFLKSVSNDNSVVGVSSIKSLDFNVAETVNTYLETQSTLSVSAKELNTLIRDLNPKSIPVRRILRDTKTYYKALENPRASKTNFHICELEQLERGDIPYFYSYLDKPQLFYRSESGETKADMPWDEFYPIKQQVFQAKKGFVEPLDEESVKKGVLQIARNYPPNATETLSHEGTEIFTKNDYLYVKTNYGWKLRCQCPKFS